MPEEKTNEATEILTENKEGTTQATSEPDWKAQAEQLKAEKESLESNYKAAQKNLNDLQTKLRQAQAAGQNVDDLKAEMKDVRKYIATALDDIDRRLPGDTEILETKVSGQSRVERLIAEESAKEAQRKAQQQEVADFVSAVQEAGLSIDDAELEAEMSKYSPREAVKKLPAFIVKRHKKEQETQIKKETEAKKVNSVKEMESSGALAIDKTSATGAKTLSREQIKRMTPDEIIRNSKELANMELTI